MKLEVLGSEWEITKGDFAYAVAFLAVLLFVFLSFSHPASRGLFHP
jgi:hypothetical protein